jgi:hypothetical protein
MLHNCFQLLAVMISCFIVGCGKAPRKQVAFKIEGVEIIFKATMIQRMPKSFGGEEYVCIQRITQTNTSSEYLVDHNGRFISQLLVDAGNGSRWARIYLELAQPLVGESSPFKTNALGEVSFVFKNYHTGQTSVSNCYRYNVIAFVDFDSGIVINAYKTNSTVHERNERLIGLVTSLPASQKIRDAEIAWLPTTREK